MPSDEKTYKEVRKSIKWVQRMKNGVFRKFEAWFTSSE